MLWMREKLWHIRLYKDVCHLTEQFVSQHYSKELIIKTNLKSLEGVARGDLFCLLLAVIIFFFLCILWFLWCSVPDKNIYFDETVKFWVSLCESQEDQVVENLYHAPFLLEYQENNFLWHPLHVLCSPKLPFPFF